MNDDHTMLGRALLVIEACLAERGPVSLASLTRITSLPKPTVRRIANQLVSRQLLQLTPAGYLSGAGLASLGERAAQQQAERLSLVPYLTELHSRTRGAVFVLGAGMGSSWPLLGSIYDSASAESGYANRWPRGADNPAALASAAGLMVLAHDPTAAERLVRTGVPRLTPFTRTHPRQVENALTRAAADEEIVEHESLVLGWSCLAVPLPLPGSRTTRAVLGVVNRTPRFNTPVNLRAAHAIASSIAAASR